MGGIAEVVALVAVVAGCIIIICRAASFAIVGPLAADALRARGGGVSRGLRRVRSPHQLVVVGWWAAVADG